MTKMASSYVLMHIHEQKLLFTCHLEPIHYFVLNQVHPKEGNKPTETLGTVVLHPI